ncbi:integrase domain-containing protein, partial [Acinetobacter baumannii]
MRLKASWTKGGRARVIPITSDKQRQELKAALVLAKDGSLIPPEKTYKAHLATWEKVTNALESGQTHGLRHGYAQDRYLQLMGFPCPAVGGYRELTELEKAKDRDVRMQISEE